MNGSPTALVIRPSTRDRINLGDPLLDTHVRTILLREDGSAPTPAALIQRVADDPRFAGIDGVFGSSDSSAHLAVHLASRFGLPGPTPEAFMRCHDKLASRRLQAEAVPEATPRFFPLDPYVALPDPLPVPFPLFVKPVSAHLSQLAYPVRDRRELEAVLGLARAQLDAIAAFDEALEGRSFHLMVAEELLTGRLVTFEGFMCRGTLTPIGVTDSVLHPNGISFLRFDYPSALSAEVQSRIVSVAERLMPALGFDDSLFNIEFFVDDAGAPKIVEVNGRMASQFTPLVRAVHGVSPYGIQLELVTGGTPTLPPADPGVVASSFVLRHYEEAIVDSVPDPTTVLDRFPGSHVEILVRPGQLLSDNDDDSASHRLAVAAMSGPDRETLIRRWDEVQRLLPFELVPTDVSARSTSH